MPHTETAASSWFFRGSTFIIAHGGFELRVDARQVDVLWFLTPENHVECHQLATPMTGPDSVRAQVQGRTQVPPEILGHLLNDYAKAVFKD